MEHRLNLGIVQVTLREEGDSCVLACDRGVLADDLHHSVHAVIAHPEGVLHNQVIIKDGRYVPPDVPGYSVTMYPESIAAYSYPNGSAWTGERS